jgi:hypothetical protein
VAVVCNRTIPTERLPLLGEVSANFLQVEGVAWSAQRIPRAVNLGFLDQSRHFFIQVAPQLWGWVDPVPDPLLLRKHGTAGNRTRDLWTCSQKLELICCLLYTLLDANSYVMLVILLTDKYCSMYSTITYKIFTSLPTCMSRLWGGW